MSEPHSCHPRGLCIELEYIEERAQLNAPCSNIYLYRIRRLVHYRVYSSAFHFQSLSDTIKA